MRYFCLLLIGICTACGSDRPAGTAEASLKDGDIIFQTSRSAQSEAIQRATGSRYSHMGMICFRDDKPFVFEAIQPVQMTSLDEWISRGVDGRYVVKRLKNSEEILTKDVLHNMFELGREFNGRDYDIYFDWSDDRIYCSELVWKIYNRATGIEIGRLQKLVEFDLDDAVVREVIQQRYGTNIPTDAMMISPGAMFNSDHLVTVLEN